MCVSERAAPSRHCLREGASRWWHLVYFLLRLLRGVWSVETLSFPRALAPLIAKVIIKQVI